MSVTKTNRDLNTLSPNAQLACKLLFQECYKAGITNIFITETYRSPERQKYLYAQGRTRPGQVVTWTLSSNHANRLAWDIAICWPNDLYDTKILNSVGAIAKRLNITWGGDWSKNIDRPHFEIKANWNAPNGYKLEGELIVPIDSKSKVQYTPHGQQDTVQGVDELEFTSATLKESLDNRLTSPATAKLIDAAAVKELGYTSKLKDGKLTDGDLLSIATELAVHYAKKK